MTDPTIPPEPETIPADLVKAPEQPPMDDASGQDEPVAIDDAATDDLSVQGGE